MPPVQPMLAKSATRVPTSDPMLFEPKWDGFRCLVFRDGDEVELTSRNTKPLTRYFPEVVEAVLRDLPERVVLDGELFVAVTADDGTQRLDFDALSERIHPADSRVRMLAESTPAGFVAFDLLALGDDSWLDRPFRERRAALEQALGHLDSPAPAPGGEPGGSPLGARCHLTRTTEDVDEATAWFTTFEGAGLDGVVAKPLDAAYTPNQRTMVKVKHTRTADVVLAGYREHKTSTSEHPLVGSLLLGLYDEVDGEPRLQHVGVAASFTASRRAALVAELADLVCDPAEHPWGAWSVANPDRIPGAQSRWSAGKDLSFVPLRPERVLEVKYDHMEGRRFRHTAHFVRWRPDRDPLSCGYGQLEEPVRYDLARILGTDHRGARP